MVTLRRWGVIPLWRFALLLSPIGTSLLVMKVFDFAVEPKMVITVVVYSLEQFFVLLVLRLRCREAGVDVLRDQMKLPAFSSSNTR